MKSTKWFALLLVLSLVVFGCDGGGGGGGGSDDPSDACENAADKLSDCDFPLEDYYGCDEVADLEDEASEECNDSAAALFNCLAGLTCAEWDEEEEYDTCDDEWDDAEDDCDDLDFD